MKFRQLPLFYKIYLSSLGVFIFILIVFTIVFYNFIASYNQGIHETVSQNFYKNVFLEKDIDKILDMSNLKQSEFENYNDVESYISHYLDKNLSYTYITSTDADDKTRKYIVKADDCKIATFTLTQDENNDYYPNTLLFHLPNEYETTIRILDSSTLYINGIKTGSKYITDTAPHENAAYLPDNVQAPKWLTYKITGLTKQPEISIIDRNGNSPELVDNNGVFQENIIADTEETDLIQSLLTAAKEYAKCMQYDAPKSKVLPYFEKGTPLYESIKTVENMFVWDHAGYAFEDEEISDFMRYDENTVSVRIAFTHVLKKHGKQDYKDRTDITYFAKNNNGKYLIYDRYNN